MFFLWAPLGWKIRIRGSLYIFVFWVMPVTRGVQKPNRTDWTDRTELPGFLRFLIIIWSGPGLKLLNRRPSVRSLVFKKNPVKPNRPNNTCSYIFWLVYLPWNGLLLMWLQPLIESQSMAHKRKAFLPKGWMKTHFSFSLYSLSLSLWKPLNPSSDFLVSLSNSNLPHTRNS